MFRRIWIGMAVSLLALAFAMTATAGQPASGQPASKKDFESAQKTVNAIVKACKANDKEEVKKYLSKGALADISKDPSSLDMFMLFCGELSIDKNSTATVEGKRMTIVKTTKDESGTMTETTRLVKEDGMWKFGPE